MGYTTRFNGEFEFDNPPAAELVDYINRFSRTRHVQRDVEEIMRVFSDWKDRCWKDELGDGGEYFTQDCSDMYDRYTHAYDIDTYKRRNAIVDDNYPPRSQPSLWCCWEINDKGKLIWDKTEKFYEYVKWLEYLISNFFEPEGLKLSGICTYVGEEAFDCGYILVENNRVTQVPFRDEYELMVEHKGLMPKE